MLIKIIYGTISKYGIKTMGTGKATAEIGKWEIDKPALVTTNKQLTISRQMIIVLH